MAMVLRPLLLALSTLPSTAAVDIEDSIPFPTGPAPLIESLDGTVRLRPVPRQLALLLHLTLLSSPAGPRPAPRAGPVQPCPGAQDPPVLACHVRAGVALTPLHVDFIRPSRHFAQSSYAASAPPTISPSRSPSTLGRRAPAPLTPTRPASPASASPPFTLARRLASSTPSLRRDAASSRPASTSTRAPELAAAPMGRTLGWRTSARSMVELRGVL